MVYVYILESEQDGTWYVGMTQDLENRLKEHNSGKSKFTSGHAPWKLIYSEPFQDYPMARIREKNLKTTSGKAKIRKLLIG